MVIGIAVVIRSAYSSQLRVRPSAMTRKRMELHMVVRVTVMVSSADASKFGVGAAAVAGKGMSLSMVLVSSYSGQFVMCGSAQRDRNTIPIYQ